MYSRSLGLSKAILAHFSRQFPSNLKNGTASGTENADFPVDGFANKGHLVTRQK